ncbi:hypothetical protein BVC71_04765 [Marivivens niveibacter]|uniref:EamA domain-containing protein n=1 Tax=Marivivens niveibacter TaxID=1930667 RepID=A0A251X349_9RHOB|nr:DMT family transporter [Marivivens niveibacter]OUD10798.1 hypothetical protein BVC71_04765 [Marivivens niveibacter]
MTEQLRLTPRGWVMILILALVWAGSFTANRGALETVGVYTTVAIRVTGGAFVLWVWVALRRQSIPREWKYIPIFFLHGLLNNALPFSLIVWGQQYIDSGLASILNATTALFTVILASLFFADERLSLNRLIGVIIGFLGVVIVIGVEDITALGSGPTALGEWAILAATLSYAVSAILSRKTLKGLSPEVASAGMLSGAGVIMGILALTTEDISNMTFNTQAIISVAYLAILSSAFAYILFFKVLNTAGAGNLSLVTLLVTPFAIILGALFFGEALEWNAYLGFIVLAFGLAVLDGRLPIGKTRL